VGASWRWVKLFQKESSSGEAKESDEVEIAAGIADEVHLELERELAEQEFENWGSDAASLGGSSDVEN